MALEIYVWKNYKFLWEYWNNNTNNHRYIFSSFIEAIKQRTTDIATKIILLKNLKVPNKLYWRLNFNGFQIRSALISTPLLLLQKSFCILSRVLFSLYCDTETITFGIYKPIASKYEDCGVSLGQDTPFVCCSIDKQKWFLFNLLKPIYFCHLFL